MVGTSGANTPGSSVVFSCDQGYMLTGLMGPGVALALPVLWVRDGRRGRAGRLGNVCFKNSVQVMDMYY